MTRRVRSSFPGYRWTQISNVVTGDECPVAAASRDYASINHHGSKSPWGSVPIGVAG